MTPKQHSRGGFLGGIIGGFGGGIFGSSAWLIQNSAATKDWIVMTTVIIFAIILFIVCIKICIAKPTRQWVVTQWAVAALGVLSLVVVNLRWEKWTASPLSEKLLSPSDTLMKANLILIAAFAGLILLFFIFSKTLKKQLVEYELQQMQIKDL